MRNRLTANHGDVGATSEPVQPLSNDWFEAIPVEAMLLDAEGRIVTVNSSWKRARAKAGPIGAPCDAGTDYCDYCERLDGIGVLGLDVARGIADVLSGERVSFSLEYTSTGRGFVRRNRLVARAAPVGAVVTHVSEDDSSDERLTRVMEIPLDLMCIAGVDGYFKRVNSAFEKLLGHSKHELLTRPFTDFIHPDDVAPTKKAINSIIDGNEVIDFENRYKCRDGSYRWLSWRSTAVLEGGLIYATARDVTSRKRMQQLVEQTHAAARIGGWELDLSSHDVYWTNETYRLYDTAPADHAPTLERMLSCFTGTSRALFAAAIEASRERGEPFDLDLELRTLEGRGITGRVTGRAQLDEAGRPFSVYGSVQDVTERKQAEIDRERFASIARATTDFVGMATPDCRPFFINEAGLRLLGLPGDTEVSDVRAKDHLPEWVFQRVAEEAVPMAMREGSWSAETVLLQSDGHEIPVSVVLLAHTDKGGGVDFLTAIIRDLTDRKRLEAQLLNKQEPGSAPTTDSI